MLVTLRDTTVDEEHIKYNLQNGRIILFPYPDI